MAKNNEAGKKKHTIRNILIGLVVLIVIFSVIGGSGDESDDGKSNSESQNSTSQSVGQGEDVTKETESWEITYQNYQISQNSLGDLDLYAIVEVENTGTVDLYLDDATFDFENSDGSLAATYSSMISSDPEIIAPGEKGYFYCNMASLDGEVDVNAEYTFVPNLKIEKSKNDIIRYPVSDLSISEGDSLSPLTVIGRVENNTEEDDGLIWVACVLFREDDTPIAAFGTNVTDLAAGQKSSFSADAVWLMNLNIKFDDIARYEVYACKSQFQF